MAASATGVKVLNVLKQCCNPLDVIHSVHSKKNLKPVLDWTIKKVPSFRKAKDSGTYAGTLLQICLNVLENKRCLFKPRM